VALTPEQISLINDMIHAWVEDKAKYRQAFRNDCKRLLATHPAKAVDTEAVKRFAAVVRVMESANKKREAMHIWDDDLVAAKIVLSLLNAGPGQTGDTTGNASSETEGGR
jgi:hypothetical protein